MPVVQHKTKSNTTLCSVKKQKKSTTYMWFLLFLYVVITTVYVSCYGALQNQISYSVSKGVYFKHHKFEAFEGSGMQAFHEKPRDSKYHNLYPTWGNRIGAAVIGVKASWWFGLALGLFLGLTLIIVFWEDVDKVRQEMFWSLILAAGIALCLHVMLSVWFIMYRSPQTLPVYDLYYKAGIIHNCAYASGILGAVAVLFYIAFRAGQYHV